MSHSEYLDWYASCSPFRLDLVGEYAGSSRFLIHGDSLLRHCFSDPGIDFRPTGGFQILHAVYVVESFLAELKKRKCEFDVVFVEEDRRLCVPPGQGESAARWLCARAVVKKHLEALEKAKSFEKANEQALDQWLRERKPLFVMAVDGEDIAIERSDDDSAPSEDTDEVQEWHIKALLQRLMRMGEGYNIALLDYVEFVDSKIFTELIENSPTSSAARAKAEALPESIMPSYSIEEKPPPLLTGLKDLRSGREYLAIATLASLLTGENAESPELASLFLLHSALLSHLSLEQRQWRPPPESSDSEEAIRALLDRVAEVAITLLQINEIPALATEKGTPELCDLVDGRLMLRLALEGGAELQVPDRAREDFARLASAVKASGIDVALSIPSGLASLPESEAAMALRRTPVELLPFSNSVLDGHLKPLGLDPEVPEEEKGEFEIPDDSDESEFGSETEKPPVTVPGTQKAKKMGKKKFRLPSRPQAQLQQSLKNQGKFLDRRQRRLLSRAFKGQQRYASSMQRYAASLVDSVDGSIDPKLIICEPPTTGKPAPAAKKPATPAKQEKQQKGKPQKEKPGKKSVMSKADVIKAQNAEKQAVKEAHALQNPWKALCRDLGASKDDEGKLVRLDEHMKKLKKVLPRDAPDTHEGRFIQLDIAIYKIWILQAMWLKYHKKGEKETGFTVLSALFDEARRALQSPALTKAAKKVIENVFSDLGIAPPPSKPAPLAERALGFQTKWTGKTETPTPLGITSEEFQLLHCGHYMDRDMDSKPDPRVPFEPDGWQRKVLDEIDANNSVFVVAPTSAGKTFISFHAMENVLKADDDGILVYVAPTKALVNQIAAEVISRFRKNYKHAGKTVWSISTREYRMHNPNECQILVTIPHVLSTMLMNPHNARAWSPRIKRIIFDEVHSIGNAEDGIVWEQLLLLCPCPMVALSATVGNPDEFSEWLQSTQKTLGIKLTMVMHPHRYSDLRKYVYRPKNELMRALSSKPFEGMLRTAKFGQFEGEHTGFEAIHPVAALIDQSNGIPGDLALEPRDSLQLYRTMKKFETDGYRVPADIDYKKVFGTSGRVIKKVDCIRWEASLKAILKTWMGDADSPFNKVVHELGKPLLRDEADTSFEVEGAEKTTPVALEDYDLSKLSDTLRYGTLPLLNTLAGENALPAILFSYYREVCETLAVLLCSQLQLGEEQWRKTDPKWKNTLKEWEAWKKRSTRAGAKSRVASDEKTTKEEQSRNAAEAESSPLDTFDPNDPSPGFTFADSKRCNKSEFNVETARLDVPEILLEALRRGIGVHHSGLNRHYRQAVETLFRKGYLRVIIATETLALGINMPCKTVVFAGDSVYLNALNYRQASGRAGRRGFDLLGNVIFHDLSLSKVQRLISSRLPSLLGHFPLGTSLILRLLMLLHHSDDSLQSVSFINTLFAQPRMVIGGLSERSHVLHHVRFSIEFLRRHELLADDGSPMNFAGLATHLFYEESGAYALHALLRAGYFEGVCEDIDAPERQKQICIEIMLTMAHLFGRKPAPIGSGIHALPPMPEAVRNILANANELTLHTYENYVTSYTDQYCKSSDHTLPFSACRCGGAPPKANSPRSNFVALSTGEPEHFADLKDLTTSARPDILFETSSIPYIPTSDPMPRLNSYLYAFYQDGDTIKLAKENNIGKAEVWFVLKDFSLVLATVIAGLHSYLKDGPGAYFEDEELADDIAPKAQKRLDGVVEEGDDDEEAELGGFEEEGLRRVLRAFRFVQEKFEEKFKAMYA